ncbi:hypothetical protein ATEIFO6365_0014012400 [Aspergillus terreus]|uniref:Uncharacterized protein n=1 Tax=Aspergillus terreus TaxID=33178 RepID=A0A5M3Z4M1_ASPTE|nr:hypothetical protein ATETN484_0008036400 [Aspergillus terreus]GFF21192.1 hypothetical protein ATEIFO6365_0014012400 [Aspergillus terreus]
MRFTSITLAFALSSLAAATTPTLTERAPAQLRPLKTVPKPKPLIARVASPLPSSSSIPSGCSASEDTCGVYCIPSSYTCCPDKSGGCAADEYCAMGDNDQYGCCPEGETCTGDGGSQEYYGDGSQYNDDSSSGSSSDSSSDSTDAAGHVKPGLAGVGAGIMGVIALAAL